jgi:ABC-type proline/glycine betaine transport system ATPase subunit
MEVPMSNANAPAIAVRGLQKRFGDLEALAGIDFEVTPATVFGLLGPNGAGKTTAVRILTTILEPDGGTAEVLGFDVVRDAERVRLRIGLAGQAATVDPNLTGRENLRLVGRLAQRPRAWVDLRAAELLELSSSRRRPTDRSRRTPAGCGAGSTWPRRWSGGLLSCSSTSPRRAWTSRAGTRCGGRSATSWRRGRPCS